MTGKENRLVIRELKLARKSIGKDCPSFIADIDRLLSQARSRRILGKRSNISLVRKVHDLAWRIRNEWKFRIDPRPHYFVVDETDCDHCRVIDSHRAKNGWQYIDDTNAIFDGREGPVRISRCTKAEWKDFRRVERDYVLEATEDGHPHSVAG